MHEHGVLGGENQNQKSFKAFGGFLSIEFGESDLCISILIYQHPALAYR
jgi:hypothetical protein